MNHSQIHDYCMQLPGATRDIKWGADEVFSIGGKMFLVRGLDPGEISGISLKVESERFLEFTDRPGILPSPYLARYHWVRLDRPDVFGGGELKALIDTSYRLVRAKLPKRLRDGLPAFTG
jgi:predicted DNA-binding protein (MmcQ/YjbR family)